MSVIEYGFYSRVDDTLLGTLTDTTLKEMAIRPALYELGSGLLKISRHDALASEALIKKGNVVRVKIPTISSTALWGWVLKDGDFNLISFKEQGGEDLEYSGPGLLYLLEAARLRPTPFAPDQPELGSLTEVPARDWVWVNEPYGAIVTRIVEEGQNEPGTPLRNITLDFDRTIDSAGNLWAVVAEEFRTPIGSNVLEVAERLAAAGDFFLHMDVNLVLHAYQSLDDFTTDRTSLTYATDKVRFVKDQNILTELSRKNDGDPLTHLIQRGSDGDISTEVIPGFNEVTDIANYGWAEAGQTNDGDMLEKIAQQTIQASRTDADDFELEIKPGNSWANGEYVWSPVGSDARFWWDLVTVHTGTADHDLDNASQRVVACRIVLDQAAKDDNEGKIHKSLHFIPELSHRPYRSFASVPQNPRQPGSTPSCYCLKLCQPAIVTEGATGRFYFTDTAATLRTPSTIWDGGTGDMVPRFLSHTPSGAADSFSSWDGVNVSPSSWGLLQGNIVLSNAADLAAVQAGGTFRIQMRIGVRHGIGIDEGSHREKLEGTIRVYRPSTATYIGTMVSDEIGSVYALTDPSGTLSNRSLAGTAAGVPGALSTDELVVDLGLSHEAPTVNAAGGSVWWNDAAGSDLPEDDSTTSNLRSWLELRTPSSVSGGGYVPELVGEDGCVAHGDHSHVIISDRAPTTDDNRAAGFPKTTFWIDTVSGRTYVLTDEDAGTWLLIAAGTELPVDVADITGLIAAAIPIDDAGGYFTGTDVEAALQELGAGGGGGGGGVDWTANLNESGGSIAAFTAQGGTWAVSSGVIANTDAGAAHKRLRYNTKLPIGLPTIVETEVRIRSGGGLAGFILGYNGASLSGGVAAAIADTANKVSFEAPAAAAEIWSSPQTITTDTWYKLRIEAGSILVSIYLDGTLLGSAFPPTGTGNGPWDYVALFCHTASAEFRNVKIWTLSTGKPA